MAPATRIQEVYDNNHVSLSAATKISLAEDVARRFQACGWHTQSVNDGSYHDSVAIAEDGPTHQPVEQLIGLRAV